MVRRGLVYMTAALVLLLSTGSSAQTVAIAQISGVVADESGGALPGAEVTATHVATGAVRFVVTGARGEYVLELLLLFFAVILRAPEAGPQGLGPNGRAACQGELGRRVGCAHSCAARAS